MEDYFDGTDDFPSDYANEDTEMPPNFGATDSSDSDEIEEELQQLNLVESAQGPGVQITGNKVGVNIHKPPITD